MDSDKDDSKENEEACDDFFTMHSDQSITVSNGGLTSYTVGAGGLWDINNGVTWVDPVPTREEYDTLQEELDLLKSVIMADPELKASYEKELIVKKLKGDE